MEIDAARAAIEDARTSFRRARAAFADVLRGELRTYLDRAPDQDDDEVADEFAAIVAALYWDHADVVRVADLTAATGLTGKQLRTIAGARVVERPCGRCGVGTRVRQTGRSGLPRALCPTCRTADAMEAAMAPHATDRTWLPG